MVHAICVVVVVAFLAREIHGRSILIPSDSPELPSTVEKDHEELKRVKKSFLSIPFVRKLNYLFKM